MTKSSQRSQYQFIVSHCATAIITFPPAIKHASITKELEIKLGFLPDRLSANGHQSRRELLPAESYRKRCDIYNDSLQTFLVDITGQRNRLFKHGKQSRVS